MPLSAGQPQEEAEKPLLAACPPEETGNGIGNGGGGGGEGVGGGESSSEEDTSDEAYAARHRVKEAEERARYESFAGGWPALARRLLAVGVLGRGCAW